MNISRRLRSIRRADPPTASCVNADQTKSIVGSENDWIARAASLLYAEERKHSGSCLTPEQARDVLRWAGQVA